MPQAPAPPACSASHSLATALTGVLPVSLKSVPRLVHKIEVASDPLLALIGRAEADSARAIVLTLAGLTSARIAEAFGVREDTVRLRRSDFMSAIEKKRKPARLDLSATEAFARPPVRARRRHRSRQWHHQALRHPRRSARRNVSTTLRQSNIPPPYLLVRRRCSGPERIGIAHSAPEPSQKRRGTRGARLPGSARATVQDRPGVTGGRRTAAAAS
jgi:hypothetical protein